MTGNDVPQAPDPQAGVKAHGPAPLPLFRIADYRRGWILGILTGVIRWLEFLALGVFAYQLTDSPQLVALLAIVRVAPYALFGFVVGILSDQHDRKWLFQMALAAMIVVAGIMVVLTSQGLATYPILVMAALATGIFWLTDMPVRRRLMVDAIQPERVPRAMGIDAITNYATRGLGPLCGGLVLQFFGVTGIYVLSLVLYVACLWLVSGFGKVDSERQAESAAPAATATPVATRGNVKGGEKSRGGARLLLSNGRFMVIIGITVVYNLFCTPFIAMIPVFAQKDFGLTPATIGSLAALEGIGGVAGALLIGLFVRPPTLFAAYLAGPAMYLAAVFGLSFALSPTMTFVTLTAASFGGGCFSGTQYALVYMTAPPALRGRAFGLLGLGIGCATLGLWNAGYLFAHYPSALALRFMAGEGLILMVALAIAARFARAPVTEPR